MEFRTAAQKACYDKIASWMKELFGELAVMRDDAPMVGVMMGSALAQVAVWPWGDDDATITTRAYLVTGAELTPDLMRYLLQKNADMRFGAFGVDQDGDILFEHSIVGSSCDKGELKASVLSVLATADKYDDEIVARWGGERMLDRMRR
jgi:hypothetical protein